MTMNALPKFVNTIKLGAISIDSAAAEVTVYTGATEGSAIEMLSCCSTDTTAQILNLYLVDTAATSFALGAMSIPAYSGTNGSAKPVDLINATDMPQLPLNALTNPTIYLPAGYKLNAKAQSLHAAQTITVVAGARDF